MFKSRWRQCGGDKEDAYDRGHMVREMRALVDRRFVPLLEAPK